MPNKTIHFSTIFIWMFLFGICLYEADATLRTTFMGLKNGSSNIYLRFQPSGILMSGSEVSLLPFDHQVAIVPETFSSVVLSIYSYDIGPGYQLTIKDSDDHKISLLGTRVFKDEKKSIISDGKMVIQFKTVETLEPLPWYQVPRNSFQFTFTSVSAKPCSSEEFTCKNGKCLLKEFLCDGHNHCGDNSDQKNCVPRNSHKMTSYKVRNDAAVIWIATISICAIILIVVIVVFIVVLVRHSKLKKVVAAAQSSTNAGTGGNVPLQSVSSSVPQGPSPVNDAIQPSAPPPDVDPPQTFYGRIRNSFRRTNGTRAVEAPVKSEKEETYQVPSMYPSLDALPATPETQGCDNPNFKNEE